MNYLLIAITAYLLNALSLAIDKILLVKKLPNPALYVFYISIISLVVLLLAPLATFPGFEVLAISSASTILWTLGAYFMFRALKSGEATRVVPIIGTLIPVILLLMQAISGSVYSNEVAAVLILLSGLIFLVFPYLKGKISKEELLFEVVSALLFANSYFVLKIAYNASNFLSVFVYSRLILIPLILLILLIPLLRKKVLGAREHHLPLNLLSKTGALLFVGQVSGGVSQMLLTFAISLASPAVVNSISGIQYIFLFILSLILSKKFPTAFDLKLTKLNLSGKIAGIVLIFFGLWILSVGTPQKENPVGGVTFSARYARELGLMPDEVFEKILTDLKPKIIRLPVYWDEVEKEKDVFDFSQTEKYLKQAELYNTEVILVVGLKQPRWPECFQPDWSRNTSGLDEKVFELVKREVETFKKYPNIKYWQVENEPFVDFGFCPKPDKQRLLREIEIVKSLDKRPILVTDSGELSTWIDIFNTGDIFGTTLYRVIWSPYFGSISYPFPPIFYTIKTSALKFLTGTPSKPTIISELQAEPWPNDQLSITQVNIEKQMELFPPEKLVQNYKYARETNLGEVYFWGVEWWYYMKEKKTSIYWDIAKTILRN